MEKVLLHICCGVCAIASIKRLQEDGFEVTGFFFNPNIYPPEEYQKRLETAKKVAQITLVDLIVGPYEPDKWLAAMADYKDEPEGGARCLVCYWMRLGAAFEQAQKNGFDYFTSTLTISPHKDSKKIFAIAQEIAGNHAQGSHNSIGINRQRPEGKKDRMH